VLKKKGGDQGSKTVDKRKDLRTSHKVFWWGFVPGDIKRTKLRRPRRT